MQCVVALLLAASALFPQQPQADGGAQPITLNVSVWDKDHKFFTNLREKHFEVSVDGKPQRIDYFARRKDEPVSIGIILDTTWAMYVGDGSYSGDLSVRRVNLLPSALQGLNDLIQNARADNEYFIVRRGKSIAVELDATTNSEKVLGYLDSLAGVELSESNVDFSDAVKLGFDKIGQAKAKTKLLLLVSTYGRPRFNYDEIEKLARQNDVQLYFAKGGVPVRISGYQVAAEQSEQKIIDDSGGILLKADNPSNLQKLFGLIADELNSQYEIRFTPNVKTKPKKWNKIKVKVITGEKPHEKLFVKAKGGFYS